MISVAELALASVFSILSKILVSLETLSSGEMVLNRGALSRLTFLRFHLVCNEQNINSAD
jgi:hypothetical protein